MIGLNWQIEDVKKPTGKRGLFLKTLKQRRFK